MVSVNSTIDCPYCDGLHTQLAEYAGSGGDESAPKKLLKEWDVLFSDDEPNA